MTRALEADFSKGALPWVKADGSAGTYARRLEALAARAMGLPPPPIAEHFYGDSLQAATLELLDESGRARGLRLGRDTSRIYSLAMGTGDLPALVGDLANRLLLPAYESIATTATRICRPIVLENFRPHRAVSLDAMPGLLQVGESGEVQLGRIDDRGEIVQLVTFARNVRVSRRLWINDDLGGIRDLAVTAAQRARAVVNDLFHSTCLAPNGGLGPALSDGLTVFHATHGNVASAGALNKTLLGILRALVKKQTAGDLKLNTPARYLLVGAEQVTDAEELIATLAPAQTGPDAEPLTVLSDANITTTRVYSLAHPSVGSNFVLGRLANSSGAPLVVSRTDFRTSAIDLQVTLDVALAPMDWRFASTAAGA